MCGFRWDRSLYNHGLGVALPSLFCLHVKRVVFCIFRLSCSAILLSLLVTAVLFSVIASASAAKSAVVLLYHRFGEDKFPSTNIRLSQFEGHLKELASGGYVVLPLLDVIRALRDGVSLPDRAVAITVDDAYESVFTEGWPRLKAAGFPLTLFVSTEPVDLKIQGYMNWNQVRELAQQGVTIGNHTRKHPHLLNQTPEQAVDEILKAGHRFQTELGQTPDIFAYPFGEAGLSLIQAVRGAGFRAAFGQHSGVLHPGADPFYLPRFALNERYGMMKRFRLAVNTLPLVIHRLEPIDPFLFDGNPPLIRFEVDELMGSMERLNCFSSSPERPEIKVVGRRVEIYHSRRFAPGRTRLNCTMAEREGRWRWFGTQFYVPSKK